MIQNSYLPVFILCFNTLVLLIGFRIFIRNCVWIYKIKMQEVVTDDDHVILSFLYINWYACFIFLTFNICAFLKHWDIYYLTPTDITGSTNLLNFIDRYCVVFLGIVLDIKTQKNSFKPFLLMAKEKTKDKRMPEYTLTLSRADQAELEQLAADRNDSALNNAIASIANYPTLTKYEIWAIEQIAEDNADTELMDYVNKVGSDRPKKPPVG